MTAKTRAKIVGGSVLFQQFWLKNLHDALNVEKKNKRYFHYFSCSGFSTGQDAECGLHKFFISFNMIICMVLSVLSILPKVQEVNLSGPYPFFLFKNIVNKRLHLDLSGKSLIRPSSSCICLRLHFVPYLVRNGKQP